MILKSLLALPLSLPHTWYSEYSRNLGKSLLNTRIKKTVRPYLSLAKLRKSGYLKGIVYWTQDFIFFKTSIRKKKSSPRLNYLKLPFLHVKMSQVAILYGSKNVFFFCLLL